jgi:RalA-binding protein 1
MNIWKKQKEKRAAAKHSRNPSGDLSSIALSPVLGVPLKQSLANSRCYDGQPVPAVVRQCIDYVTEHGLQTEGIYRVSSPKPRLDELEKAANNGEALTFDDPHDAAGLLKRFLRQMPENICTDMLKAEFESAASKCECDPQAVCRCEAVRRMKEILERVPRENYCLLAYVFLHSQQVIMEQRINKMNLAALGVLLQAMLNLSRNEVRLFLLNASDRLRLNDEEPIVTLFDDVAIKPYRRPLTIDELKHRLPDTEADIQDELVKQENLLLELNQQVNDLRSRGLDVTAKEQSLWDVQTGITLLKRKLKNANADFAEEEEASEGDNTHPNGINPAFLEKQLLAVQMAVKEEIAEEKRKIAQLLSRLRELHSKLPPEALENLAAMRREAQQKAEVESVTSVDCGREEARRDELQDEVIRLRDLCAELRARLEHDTVLLKTSTQPAGDVDAGSLLVTRF